MWSDTIWVSRLELACCGASGEGQEEDDPAGVAQLSSALVADLMGARGPDGDQWPIPYLLPFSTDGNGLGRPMGLECLAELCAHGIAHDPALWLAWKRGILPLELFSRKRMAHWLEPLGIDFRSKPEA
jgi:hypothetical protein